MFEREFVETQEAHGIHVLGQFRDLDAPDHFVWLRGFDGMPARHQGLQGFYEGPVWASHREAANATMLDSDDVLLLRPAVPGARITSFLKPRPPRGATLRPGSLIALTIWSLPYPADQAIRDFFRADVESVLVGAGSPALAILETEDSPNTYPRLPVREGEHVVVRIARFDDAAAYDRYEQRLYNTAAWQAVTARLADRGLVAPTKLRLDPTPRSLLR